MYKYEPKRDPEARAWLALDEGERLELVARYHRRERAELPNLTLHSAIHTVVENQLAEGLATAKQALQRLMAEGLCRHDAVHAIGSVLAAHLHSLLQRGAQPAPSTESYLQELQELTAERWLRELRERNPGSAGGSAGVKSG